MQLHESTLPAAKRCCTKLVIGTVILTALMAVSESASARRINPRLGVYDFNRHGCFSVVKRPGKPRRIRFASNCYNFFRIPFTKTRTFHFQWGEIGGVHCPTDGFIIRGRFVSDTAAKGTISYASQCQIEESHTFRAKWIGP